MKNLKNAVPVVVAIASMAVATAAQADLPTGLAAGLTEIQTDALALIDLVWPVVLAITGGFVLFKMFKRGASKV